MGGFSKRRKVSKPTAKTTKNHSKVRRISKLYCCICNKEPNSGLLHLSTLIDAESSLSIATIVEQVACIKVKYVKQSICNNCWNKIQAAYTIQKEIRDSGCLLKQEQEDEDSEDSQIAQEENVLYEQYRMLEVIGERCCGCSFVAQNRKQLLQHSGTIHAVDIVDCGDYCPICFYKFSTDKQLERHIQEFKSSKIYVCLRCNQFYNLRGQLFNHLLKCTHTDSKEVLDPDDAADDSNGSNDGDEDYLEEYCNEDPAETFETDESTTQPDNDQSLNATDPRIMHRYRVQFEEILSSETISYELDEAGLNVQDIYIASQRTFDTFKYVRLRGLRCCGCSYTSFSNPLFVEHGKKFHPIEENVVDDRTCSLCAVRFSDEMELVKHLCFFTSRQLFFCTVCNESFLNKESLCYHQTHNERHRELQIDKLHQAGIEMIGSTAFVELEQPDVVEQLEKLLAEKVTYRSKIVRCIPMPDARFITGETEYNNYIMLSVRGVCCCGCRKYFENLTELKLHSKMEHYLPFESSGQNCGQQCEICYATFDFERGLTLHKLIRRAKKHLFICKLCGLLFSKKFCLAKHLKTAPNHLSRLIVDANNSIDRNLESDERVDNPEATVAESDPRVLEALQLHRSVEEAGLDKVGHLVWYHCCFSKCKVTFTDEESLLEHAREEHNGQRRENENERNMDTNVCPGCCKPFQTLAKLMWHRFQRFVPREYSCKQCDKKFDRWPKLKIHVGTVHEGRPPNFVCPQCNKSFQVRSRLKAHMQTHEKKEYVCDVCGDSFGAKGLLKRHRRALHSTELLFECKLCGKKFAVSEKLKIHQRVHTGERPFECSYCHRTFSHFIDRKRHEMSAHTGERPFKCNLCPVSYIRKRELSLHMQKHNVEEKTSER
ncbi:zinc finger protein 850-like [Anopheles nili]|uniref:zinc finger protein 850-like n=1 Tax=Anopheles nili TaxID=185578 RepID=UPI00237A2FE2|nr:zinc finger protein 850-like [Anopheles nili]